MISRSNGFMMYSLAPALSASVMCAVSFSVVQNTTIGFSPARSRRSARRNSIPVMFGIDQSSRIISGMCARQASSAVMPSSASTVSKPRSERMRHATLRITRLSSTTRQDFMRYGLLGPRSYAQDGKRNLKATGYLSRRQIHDALACGQGQPGIQRARQLVGEIGLHSARIGRARIGLAAHRLLDLFQDAGVRTGRPYLERR